MIIEKITLNQDRNVTLTAYIHEKSPEYKGLDIRPAIVVLPGGGYSMCSDREADCVATEYVNAGFHAFVLRYTLKTQGGWPLPLNDYDEALTLIKQKKDIWGIDTDRIGVVGFSAGGHLAACAATLAKNRPSVAILGYPALKKDIVDACQPNMSYPTEHIDTKTCPCFIFASRDDNIVPIDGMLDFQQALYKHGINFESHVYSFGGHGFSIGRKPINESVICDHACDWVKDSLSFISDIWGEFSENGFSEPNIGRCVNGDYDDTLSVNCTYGHLLKSEQARQIILPVINAINGLIEANGNSNLLDTITRTFKLTDLLQMFKLDKLKSSINTSLKAIKNNF